MRRRVIGPAGVAAGLLLVAGAAAGCGAEASPNPAPATTTTAPGTTSTAAESTTTTAAPVVPTWPLTGVATDDAAGLAQPAIVVKVDNSPQARPHAGINQADLVYELQVEGITRFMEVFHSDTPDRIGPVRSARSSDINLLSNLNRPMLVWSGGNPGVTNEVLNAESQELLYNFVDGGTAANQFSRDQSRMGLGYEHTLFINALGLRTEYTPEGAGPPQAVFARRTSPTETLPPTAQDIPGITVDFGQGVRIDYVWDAERGGWDRFQVDERHNLEDSAFVDEAGDQVAPPTVVVLNLPYELSGSSPVAQSVGGGSGLILTEGKALLVNWMRNDPQDPWVLIDPTTSQPVSLPAGRTWVALPQQDVDQLVPMAADHAAELLALKK